YCLKSPLILRGTEGHDSACRLLPSVFPSSRTFLVIRENDVFRLLPYDLFDFAYFIVNWIEYCDHVGTCDFCVTHCPENINGCGEPACNGQTSTSEADSLRCAANTKMERSLERKQRRFEKSISRTFSFRNCKR